MAENETSSPLQRYGGYAVLGIVVVAIAVLAVWYFASGGEDEGPAAFDPAAPEQFGTVGLETGVIGDQPPEVGEPAPDFALANARDPERVVRLSDFRGTPVVLNWYASWCGPCRREIPDFQKAYNSPRRRGRLHRREPAGRPRAGSGAAGCLRGEVPGSARRTDGAVAEHYRLLGMPTTFFIDADGIVRASGAGLITEEVLVEELARIGVTYTPE